MGLVGGPWRKIGQGLGDQSRIAPVWVRVSREWSVADFHEFKDLKDVVVFLVQGGLF